ncbi:MAG: LysE family transporter, partial [Rubrivivax sp.]|nr:LysE family transporter [Rubrivivax sp.]
MELFAQALLIGFSIAAPVGPIGLLVIQRTLQRGAAMGLATGLGAALADAVYGALGAFGVTGLISALQAARVPLALGGGAFLLWLALQSWRAPPASRAAPAAEARDLLGSLAGTFGLTLANPATIFSFIAIFGSLGARTAGASPWVLIAGVLLGSALWWLLL